MATGRAELVQQVPPSPERSDLDGPKTAQRFPGAEFDIVAMASSAGGIAAIGEVLAGLPADFPAAIVVVQHLDPRHRSLMAETLRRRTRLEIVQAVAGGLDPRR